MKTVLGSVPDGDDERDPLEYRDYSKSEPLSAEHEALLYESLMKCYNFDDPEEAMDGLPFKLLRMLTSLDENAFERLIELEVKGTLTFDQVEAILGNQKIIIEAVNDASDHNTELMKGVLGCLETVDPESAAYSRLLEIGRLMDPALNALRIVRLISAGTLIERSRLQGIRQTVRDGKGVKAARRAGGKSRADTTIAEKHLIIEARDNLAKQHDRPKIWAASHIAAQLRTGQFPGIDRAIEYSDKYVANLRAER